MKSFFAIALWLAVLVPLQGQERLPRQEALKYAFFLSVDLKQLLDTPIPTDPDVKRPVALRDGEYGGLLLPESKLTVEALTKVGKEVAPVGQLWMVKVAPMKDGQVIPARRMKEVEVRAGSESGMAFCCALGTQKDPNGALELLVYGKDKEPLLRVPLKAVTSQKSLETPCDLTSARKDDGAELTLTLLGKYEASFMVGAAE